MVSSFKILSKILAPCFLVTLNSCLEPVTPELNSTDLEPLLVIEGQITNEEGPFRVKLTTSIPVNVMYYPVPVLGADVLIYDDKVNIFILEGDQNGWYETADKKLKAIPGSTYTLSVTTREGIQYESTPVLMQEAPDIDSLYFEEVLNTRLEDNLAYDETWLNILLDSDDPGGMIKYWKFGFTETWEVNMLTDSVPVAHSVDSPGITLENISVSDEKKVCWVTKPSGSILITSTANNPENRIKKFKIRSLGPGEDKLHVRYSILVKQTPVSKELYDFWKKLMDTNQNAGGIYEKIPAQVFGNIICCDDHSRALGYFSASAIKEKRLFIDRTDHHVQTVSAYKGCVYFDYVMPPWVPKSYFGTESGTGIKVYCHADYCADCRAYGSNVRPDFWK